MAILVEDSQLKHINRIRKANEKRRVYEKNHKKTSLDYTKTDTSQKSGNYSSKFTLPKSKPDKKVGAEQQITSHVRTCETKGDPLKACNSHLVNQKTVHSNQLIHRKNEEPSYDSHQIKHINRIRSESEKRRLYLAKRYGLKENIKPNYLKNQINLLQAGDNIQIKCPQYEYSSKSFQKSVGLLNKSTEDDKQVQRKNSWNNDLKMNNRQNIYHKNKRIAIHHKKTIETETKIETKKKLRKMERDCEKDKNCSKNTELVQNKNRRTEAVTEKIKTRNSLPTEKVNNNLSKVVREQGLRACYRDKVFPLKFHLIKTSARGSLERGDEEKAPIRSLHTKPTAYKSTKPDKVPKNTAKSTNKLNKTENRNKEKTHFSSKEVKIVLRPSDLKIVHNFRNHSRNKGNIPRNRFRGKIILATKFDKNTITKEFLSKNFSVNTDMSIKKNQINEHVKHSNEGTRIKWKKCTPMNYPPTEDLPLPRPVFHFPKSTLIELVKEMKSDVLIK